MGLSMMKYLGYGTGRIVFQISEDLVVKIPYNKNGILQNEQEIHLYNNAKHNYFAKSYKLDENKWLYAEYVEDCSRDLEDYMYDGVTCKKYDELTDTSIKFDCNFSCLDCPYNKRIDFGNLDEFIAHKPKDRLQVGRDKEGKLKYFDYAIGEIDDSQIFHNGMLEAFMQYLKTKKYDTLFIDWLRESNIEIKKPMLTEEQLKYANKVTRRLASKTKGEK